MFKTLTRLKTFLIQKHLPSQHGTQTREAFFNALLPYCYCLLHHSVIPPPADRFRQAPQQQEMHYCVGKQKPQWVSFGGYGSSPQLLYWLTQQLCTDAISQGKGLSLMKFCRWQLGGERDTCSPNIHLSLALGLIGATCPKISAPKKIPQASNTTQKPSKPSILIHIPIQEKEHDKICDFSTTAWLEA